MTTDSEFDLQLGSWFEERARRNVPDGLLERSLERVDATRQRPGWLVRNRGRRSQADRRAPGRRWLLVMATLLVGTGVVAASLIGGRLFAPDQSPTNPNAVAEVSADPLPSPDVTVAPSPAPGMFAYVQETGYHLGRLWVAGVDGSGAHELLPDQAGNQQSPVWSSDGTRLLFWRTPIVEDAGGYIYTWRFYLTDASGAAPQLVDTGCVLPCLGDGNAAFSRDGTHLVFVRSIQTPPDPSATMFMDGKLPGPGEKSVLATMDLATGRVVELASTTIDGFLNRDPDWSPDGTRIVFTQDNPDIFKGPMINGDFAPAPGPGLFVVDADGGNLHQLTPTGWAGLWSPDGARIVFGVASYRDLVVTPGKGNGYSYTPTSDIFTIRPDGSDLRQLTSDGGSGGPAWTSDGRIWFAMHGLDTPQPVRIMDADGADLRELTFPPQLLSWTLNAFASWYPNQPALTALIGP